MTAALGLALGFSMALNGALLVFSVWQHRLIVDFGALYGVRV